MSKPASYFRSEVFEVYSECTHRGALDLEEFCNKVTGVWAAAQVDGVCESDFQDLVSELAPEALSYLKLESFKAA
jgi:hypothetical protein